MEKKIKQIAQDYLNDQNENHPFDPDYYYGLDQNPREFNDRWYFGFKIHCRKDIPLEKQATFGGAAGYTINKFTGEVEVIPFHKLYFFEMTKEFTRVLDHHLRPENNQEITLKSLKAITNLPTSKLTGIKKKILAGYMANGIERQNVIDEVIRLIYP